VRRNILHRLAHDYDDVGDRLLQLATIAKERQPSADADDLLKRVQSAIGPRAPKSRRTTISFLLLIAIGTTGLLWYINFAQGLAYNRYKDEHKDDLDIVYKHNVDRRLPVNKPESDNQKVFVAPLPDSPNFQIAPDVNTNQKLADLSEQLNRLEHKWQTSVEYAPFRNQLLLIYVFVLPSAILWIGILAIRLKWPVEHPEITTSTIKLIKEPRSKTPWSDRKPSGKLRENT